MSSKFLAIRQFCNKSVMMFLFVLNNDGYNTYETDLSNKIDLVNFWQHNRDECLILHCNILFNLLDYFAKSTDKTEISWYFDLLIDIYIGKNDFWQNLFSFDDLWNVFENMLPVSNLTIENLENNCTQKQIDGIIDIFKRFDHYFPMETKKKFELLNLSHNKIETMKSKLKRDSISPAAYTHRRSIHNGLDMNNIKNNNHNNHNNISNNNNNNTIGSNSNDSNIYNNRHKLNRKITGSRNSLYSVNSLNTLNSPNDSINAPMTPPNSQMLPDSGWTNNSASMNVSIRSMASVASVASIDSNATTLIHGIPQKKSTSMVSPFSTPSVTSMALSDPAALNAMRSLELNASDMEPQQSNDSYYHSKNITQHNDNSKNNRSSFSYNENQTISTTLWFAVMSHVNQIKNKEKRRRSKRKSSSRSTGSRFSLIGGSRKNQPRTRKLSFELPNNQNIAQGLNNYNRDPHPRNHNNNNNNNNNNTIRSSLADIHEMENETDIETDYETDSVFNRKFEAFHGVRDNDNDNGNINRNDRDDEKEFKSESKISESNSQNSQNSPNLANFAIVEKHPFLGNKNSSDSGAGTGSDSQIQNIPSKIGSPVQNRADRVNSGSDTLSPSNRIDDSDKISHMGWSARALYKFYDNQRSRSQARTGRLPTPSNGGHRLPSVAE